ncbi:hypothetical protein ACOMHN_030449 [Nucella lapillus]
MASEVMIDTFPVNSSPPHHGDSGGRKTWAQLRRSVGETTKMLFSAGATPPTTFTFRPLPSRAADGGLARLYFLGTPDRARENTLQYVDLPERAQAGTGTALDWSCLLDTLHPAWQGVGQLSREEQLMLERKRQGSYGIVAYDYSPADCRFVFPANGALYMCRDLDPGTDVPSRFPLVPKMVTMSCVCSDRSAQSFPPGAQDGHNVLCVFRQTCPAISPWCPRWSQCPVCVQTDVPSRFPLVPKMVTMSCVCSDSAQDGHNVLCVFSQCPTCAQSVPKMVTMYVCVQTDVPSRFPLVPKMVRTSCAGARLDPKICPEFPDVMAFVHSNDLWVTSLATFQEMQLTFTQANSGSSQLEDNPLTAGVPSFVMSEEFDRYTGYWWQPGVQPASAEGRQTLRVLYEEVDEGGVEILRIFAPPAHVSGVDEYRYPRAGTPNASSILKVVEFEVDSSGPVMGSRQERHLVEPLTTHCPWAEYLVRAGWTPDGKFVYAVLLSRSQQQLCVVLIPLDCFLGEGEGDMISLDSSRFPPVHCVYQEASSIWINVHDCLHFFPQTFENEISFLWASQTSGYRHLYHVTSRLSVLHTEGGEEDMQVSSGSQCHVIQERQLTSGDWDVQAKHLWVDETRAIVYFIGMKDSCLETHLYGVSYAHPGEVVRLTEPGFSHTISMNTDCTMYVTTYSSLKASPVSAVCRVQHQLQGALSAVVCSTLQNLPLSPGYTPPELFSYDSVSGYRHHGLLIRPDLCRPGAKYPTVLFVYGGPQVQLVSNSFKGIRFLRLHTLAAHGYVVVVLDGRGSCNRGLHFEGSLKDRLGTVETEDQVEGLMYMAAHYDCVDLSRVAIHGWSYGGYLALMGLAQRPDVFKLAIAGAPVVSWALYDTGYTERYLSLPEDNAEGYTKGCVLNYIKQFPDTENRLLLVHGLIDENVHFHHITKLMSALIKACKPYQLQVYPNERHGIRSHESNEHYKTMLLSFLQDNL